MNNIAPLLASQIPPLMRDARKLTNDPSRAEDLLQSCLVRALEKEHLWKAWTDLRAWLFMIMHDQHVNNVRRWVREGTVVPIEEVDANLAAVTSIEASLELGDAEQAIADLPRDQREVIMLAGHEGERYEEMARRLGVPIGMVRSRLSRGRTRLREMMDTMDVRTPLSRRWRQMPRRRAA